MNTIKTHSVANKDILDLIILRKETYLKDPRAIVEHYNNENKNINDYNGRQLLEMIQNANDECENTTKPKKVLISLEEETLIVANNGNPFSQGGVESLMYSDLSPKVKEENKVGQKGLGFRSVLNWSKEIYISSYDLNLRFSKEHSNKFLDNLISIDQSVRKIIKEKSNEKYPISVLRCPIIENNHSSKKESSYDTVIELTLNENVYLDIQKQIEKDIIPEILVFLTKLEEIEVKTSEHHYILKKEIQNDFIIIEKIDFISNENENWTWYFLEDKGVLQNNLGKTKNYELKIAYNPNLIPNTKKLFSYFRTKIEFPYPVLAHGTFELVANRNEINDDENGFNRQLIDKLSKLLIKAALKLTEGKIATYDALNMLLPSSNNNSALNEDPWNFSQKITRYIEESFILPTINNEYISLADSPRFYSKQIDNIIPDEAIEIFTNLLKSTDNSAIKNYFEKFTNKFRYSNNDFTNKINEIIKRGLFKHYDIVEWIYILTEFKNIFYKKESYYDEEYKLPNLLISDEDKIIEFGEDILLPPEGSEFKLPPNINLQFIQKKLLESLKNRFKANVRQLSTKLKPFNIVEYAMNVVVQKLISGTHKFLENKNNDKLELIQKMHQTLFQIYKSSSNNEGIYPGFPVTAISPYLISSKGNLINANKLYFGDGYSNGMLMAGLLKTSENDIFVANKEQNGFDSELFFQEQYLVEKYLSWIGVESMPRKIIKTSQGSNEFIQYVFDLLTFPYTTPDFKDVIKSKNEIISYSIKHSFLWFDHLEEIIEKSTIEYILSWFTLDQEIFKSISLNKEFNNGELRFDLPKKQYSRELNHSDIKSFLLFYLRTKHFIPVENGTLAKPIECISNTNNLEPLVHSPKINFKSNIFDINDIREDQIQLILKRLGVKESFRDLPLDSMYSFLNKHVDVFDRNASFASNLYISIIEATTNSTIDFDSIVSEERSEFLNKGKILTIKDGESKYVSINEASYLDNKNFSQDILKNLNIAKLPLRTGNKRILELFGVQPIDYIKFYVNANVEMNLQLNFQFNNELNELKPLFFVYRHMRKLTKTQYSRELSALKNLKIKTCYNLDITYELNEVDNKLKLNKYEYIFDSNTGSYYIKLDKNNDNYPQLKNDYRFNETVADIVCGAFKVTENRKDFIILLKESPIQGREILNREFNDFSIIENEVINQFDGILTSEQRFWESILKTMKLEFKADDLMDAQTIYNKINNSITWDLFFDFYRGLNYSKLSNRNNFNILKELFLKLDIEIEAFNENSSISIDFEYYYRNSILSIHNYFSNKYGSFLYLNNDANRFIEKWDVFSDFDTNSLIIPNSFNIIVNKLYIDQISRLFNEIDFDLLTNLEVLDLNGIYNENFSKFRDLLIEKGIYKEKLFLECNYENDFKNNIFFNNIIQLEKQYKESYTRASVIENSKSASTASQILAQNLIEIDSSESKIEYYKPKKSKSKSKLKKYSKNEKKQSKNNLESQNSIEEIGYIGECKAHKELKKIYDEVIWKSENALKAGFPKGIDGLGYDFECRKGNEVKFVEVKSTSTKQYLFTITNNEVNVGHNNSKQFDILLITEVLTDNPNFKYLENIFEYEDGEYFLENSKFNVKNDTYKIFFE